MCSTYTSIPLIAPWSMVLHQSADDLFKNISSLEAKVKTGIFYVLFKTTLWIELLVPAAEADARIFEYFMYYSTFEYVICYSKLLFELSPVTCESRVSRIVIFLLDLDLEAFSFHFSFSMSRHFHFTFYFSKRVKAFQISLFFSRKNYACTFVFCHEIIFFYNV